MDISGQDYSLSIGQGALIFMHDFEAWFHPPARELYTSFSLGIPVSLFNYAAAQLGGSSRLRLIRCWDEKCSSRLYFNWITGYER